MKMFSKVKYLNSQLKVSAKGSQYRISNFIQEGSADVLSCVDKTDFSLSFGDEIEGIFEYNPKYLKLTFVGIKEVL
jgi:hypothetical protein